jgi:hypothetical protein
VVTKPKTINLKSNPKYALDSQPFHYIIYNKGAKNNDSHHCFFSEDEQATLKEQKKSVNAKSLI